MIRHLSCAGICFILGFAAAAEARPQPSELAEALAAAIWGDDPPKDALQALNRDLIAEYRLLDAAVLRGEDDYTIQTRSAALLARSAEHPATRAAMADLARQLLHHAVEDEKTSGAVALWSEADPFLGVLQLGAGLAESDVAAVARLERLARERGEDPRAALLKDWSENAWSPPNQQFMIRFGAWAAGAEAAWEGMSPEARREASGVALRSDVPSPATVEAVTGSQDLLAWLAGWGLALTPQERAAHPELMRMLDEGRLAGGLARWPEGSSPPPGFKAPGLASGGAAPWVDHDSYLMMLRMNNHLIGGGSMADPGAGAAMWGLQP